MAKLFFVIAMFVFANNAFAQSCPAGAFFSSGSFCIRATAAFCPPGYPPPYEGRCSGPALCPAGYKYAPNLNPINGGGKFEVIEPIDPCIMEVPMNIPDLQAIPNSLEMQWQKLDQKR